MSTVSCEHYGDAIVAALSGSIDRKTSPTLGAELLEAIEPASHVVCDLSDVTHISSSGYRLLLHVYHLTSAKFGQVALVGASPEIRETLSATGLREFFVLAESLDDALEQVCRESTGAQHAAGETGR